MIITIPGDAFSQMEQLEKQEYIEQLEKQGYQVEVCYGWAEAKYIILRYLEGRSK